MSFTLGGVCVSLPVIRMTRLLAVIHLACVISVICGNFCSEEYLERTLKIFIRKNYMTEYRRKFQTTDDITDDSIDILYTCREYEHTDLNTGVVSFNINLPEDYLSNNEDEGYRGRVDIKCHGGMWKIQKSNLTPVFREPTNICVSCQPRLLDPCVGCELTCGAGQTPSLDCSSCQDTKYVTKLLTASPPWTQLSTKIKTTEVPKTKSVKEETKWSTVVVHTMPHTTPDTGVYPETEVPPGTTDTKTTPTNTTPTNHIVTVNHTLNATTQHLTPSTPDTITLTKNFTEYATANATAAPNTTANYTSSMLLETSAPTNYTTTQTNATTELGFTTHNFTTPRNETVLPTLEVLNTTTIPHNETTVPTIPPLTTEQPEIRPDPVQPKIIVKPDPPVIIINQPKPAPPKKHNDVDPTDAITVGSNACFDNLCNNGGRGVCRNGHTLYCVCVSDFTGKYCDVPSAQVDDRRRASFWDWKISKYIVGGLGILALVGVLLLLFMGVRCMKSKDRARRTKYAYNEHDIGMGSLNVAPAPVVMPFIDTSTRGSSGVIDEKSDDEEEFPLASDDDMVSMTTSTDQVVHVHRPHYPDPNDDGLHHTPSHRVPSSPVKHRRDDREYMNSDVNKTLHRDAVDSYAHLDRSYSKNTGHEYLNVP